jgi:hypothetical protein
MGSEWSYGFVASAGTGVFSAKPGACAAATPDGAAAQFKHREAVAMGATSLTAAEIVAVLDKLDGEWQGSEYDLLRRNCCHFSDALCQALGVGKAPKWVTNLAGAGATLSDAHAKAAATITAAAATTAAAAVGAKLLISERATAVDDKFRISERVSAAQVVAAAKADAIDEQYRSKIVAPGNCFLAARNANACGLL